MRKQVSTTQKCYMHAVRMFEGAIEILNTGHLTVKLPDAERFVGYRNGCDPFNVAIKRLELLDMQLLTAYQESELPEEPNYKRVNDFLVELNEQHLRLFRM